MNKSVGGAYQTDTPVFDAHLKAAREARERDRLRREQEAATSRAANRQAAIVAGLVAVAGVLVLTTCSTNQAQDQQVERSEASSHPSQGQAEKG